MSKSKKEETPKVSKGLRRHNASNNRGTILQGVAVSQPRFMETAIPGVLNLRGNTNTMIARDKSNRWASLSKKAVAAMLPLPTVEPS
jgi:hypothetical protein